MEVSHTNPSKRSTMRESIRDPSPITIDLTDSPDSDPKTIDLTDSEDPEWLPPYTYTFNTKKSLGLSVRHDDQYFRVTNVANPSQAFDFGVEEDWIVTKVSGMCVDDLESLDDFKKLIKDAKGMVTI